MPSDCAIVFGALRSGTTMLRLMLDGHPDLCCTGEHDFLFDHLHDTPLGWRYDCEALGRDRIFREAALTLPGTEDGAVALADLIAQIAARGGARPVLMLHRGLAKAVRLLPQAPVIHFLRDPRDVARSSIGMGWEGNVYFAIVHWLETEAEWDASAADVAERSLELRYETLVSRPEATLEYLCAHIGLRYDPAMLAYPATTTYDAPDARLAEQWRRKLGPRDIRLVEARLGPVLAAKGYAPSGQPPLAVTPPLRVWLGLQSAAGRWRHLLGRYGLLPVQRGIGRRLGLKRLEWAAQARMDEIVTRTLR